MRGSVAEVGARRTSPNGYLYEKTEDGWRLVHRLVMEEKLGRKLRENEYVCFRNEDKTDTSIKNLELRHRGATSIRRRIAQLEARISELVAARDELIERLEVQKTI